MRHTSCEIHSGFQTRGGGGGDIRKRIDNVFCCSAFSLSVSTRALLFIRDNVKKFTLWHKYRTTARTRVKDTRFSFVDSGVLEDERKSSYLYRQIHPGKRYPWMKPFTDLARTIFSASSDVFIESVDWIKVPSESKLKESVGDLPKLTDVESSLYIYLELLRTGGFRLDMKFPFANRRDWIDIIAETVETHYQESMLNTANPDESIELWNISAEFYPENHVLLTEKTFSCSCSLTLRTRLKTQILCSQSARNIIFPGSI